MSSKFSIWSGLVAWLSTLVLFLLVTPAEGRAIPSENVVQQSIFTRPSVTEVESFARWLVHSQTRPFGVLSTRSVHLDGAPYGKVWDYTDGTPGSSTGRLLFYMDKFDASVHDISVFPYASLTIAEAQLHPRCTMDPEDPTCSRITLSGKMVKLSDSEAEEGKQMFFSRHPQAKSWEEDHGWHVYELHINNIFMLNFYGGAKNVSVQNYFEAECCHDSDSTQLRASVASTLTQVIKSVWSGELLPQWASASAASAATTASGTRTSSRPASRGDPAQFARWLVRGGRRLPPWGVLSTTSVNVLKDQRPFGNVVSYADLPTGGEECSGRLVFYLTAMDATVQDLRHDPRATLTISEDSLSGDGCQRFDPEDPNCAKIMLTGRMKEVPTGEAYDAATAALFTRHPQMASWPDGHGWLVYEMHITNILMLNHYGPATDVEVADFFSEPCPEFDDDILLA